MENKVDNLTDLVLLGFTNVLQGQSNIQDHLSRLEQVLQDHFKDEAQKDLMREYFQYIELRQQNFKLAQICTNNFGPSKAEDAIDCYKSLALRIADSTINTAVTIPNAPDKWSNNLLSVLSSDQNDHQFVLEQLSSPLVFAENLEVFKGVIARNHEAIGAYGKLVLGIPHSASVYNPETIADALQIYLSATKRFPIMRTRDAAELTRQGLTRIKDIENLVKNTSGSREALVKIWSLLRRDIIGYENAVSSLEKKLMAERFQARRDKLNEKIYACDPRDPGSLPTVAGADGTKPDKFVPQIYWLAQELQLGTITHCYEMGMVPEKAFHVSDRSSDYFRTYYVIRTNFVLNTDINSMTDAFRKQISGSKDSLPISARKILSKAHYTTNFDSGWLVVSQAWLGNAPNGTGSIVAVGECSPTLPKPQQANCAMEKNRYGACRSIFY